MGICSHDSMLIDHSGYAKQPRQYNYSYYISNIHINNCYDVIKFSSAWSVGCVQSADGASQGRPTIEGDKGRWWAGGKTEKTSTKLYF